MGAQHTRGVTVGGLSVTRHTTREAPPLAVMHALLVVVVEMGLLCYAWGAGILVTQIPWSPPYNEMRLLVLFLDALLLIGLIFHRATRRAIARGVAIRPGLPAHFSRAWVLYTGLVLSALVSHFSGHGCVIFAGELLAYISFPVLVPALAGVMLAEHQAIRDAAP